MQGTGASVRTVTSEGCTAMFEILRAGFVPVQQAHTEAEREAIFRLRYDIYVGELGKRNVVADHERRWIKDPEDDAEGTALFYSGPADAPVGTSRAQIWRPGRVPRADFEMLGMDRFPGIAGYTTAEGARLMIRPSARGSLVMPALAIHGYRYAVAQGVDLIFAWCAPGLVHAYRRLGYRPYGMSMIPTPDGLRVPLVGVPSDLAYLQKVRSPLLPLALLEFAPGRRPRLDMAPLLPVLEGAHTFEADPEHVWRDLQEEVLQGEAHGSPLFRKLPDSALHLLAQDGFTMEVEEGGILTKEDLVEREMFVVLEGVFQVEVGNHVVDVAHPGEICGFLEMFLESGRRRSTIRAATRGKVLILRRKFLDDLEKRNPALANQVLRNLCSIMAHQLDHATHAGL